MTDTDILVLRHMLRILIDLGPAGIEERPLQEQAEIAAGIPLTTTEKDLAIKALRDRGWVATYRVPATGRIRFYATEPGKIAYASL